MVHQLVSAAAQLAEGWALVQFWFEARERAWTR